MSLRKNGQAVFTFCSESAVQDPQKRERVKALAKRPDGRPRVLMIRSNDDDD